MWREMLRPPSSSHCKCFNAAKPTGVAQRKRAGLITPRSLDRNGSPVFSNYNTNDIFTFVLYFPSSRCYYICRSKSNRILHILTKYL